MTTRHYSTTVAVAIEAIGSSTSKTNGYAFCYGTTPTHTSNYEYIGGMIDAPDSVETSVNPYTGEIDTSSFTFRFAASDDIARKLLHVQVRTPLTTTISFGDATTTVRVSGTGSTTLAGSVVYIDDEAILLGTHSGSGVYASCTRGFWGTTATGHGAGIQVYTANSYIQYRRVTMLTIDRASGTETVRWRGFVDSVATDESGKIINVTCIELWAAIRGAAVNRGAPRLQVTGHVVNVPDWQRPTFIGSLRAERRVLKTGSGTSTAWYQLGDTLTVGSYSTSTKRTTFDGPAAYWLGAPDFEWESNNSSVGNTPAQTYADTAYEVFVADARVPGSTDDLTYPLHPVAIAMALLMSGPETTPSGYDVLGEKWGLAIPSSLFDTSAIGALIASTADVKIDRLLLGWDGEQVDVLSVVINTLLRPYGFYLGITDAGLLTVGRVDLIAIDVGSAATAYTPIPTRLSWDVNVDGQFWQAEAKIGALPWREPDTVIAQRDGSFRDASRKSVFSRSARTTYDFQTLAPESDRSAVVGDLISQVVRGKQSAPIIGVTLIDGGTYDLGGVIALTAPNIQQAWWINADGTRTTLTAGDPSFAGIIIGRRYDIGRRVYELSILLTNWSSGQFVRWRAPSAAVTGIAANVLTVSQNAFHAGVDDTSFFEVGDEVYFVDKSGAFVENGFEVTAVTSTTITLDGSPATAAAGDFLRLEAYNFTNGSAHITGVSRPYAAFAVSGVIEKPATTFDPDIYG